MKVAITSKLPDVGTSIFATMSGLANECNAINLSQGFPDFSIDPGLKAFVQEGLDKDQVQYAPMPGRLDLREAISTKILGEYQVKVDPINEITITAGGTQSIYCAIAAVINPGDEVIILDPAYDCYDPAVKMHGGIPVHLKLSFPDYKVNWAELENRVTTKTKMIMFNNPHNPSGSVWTKEDISKFETLALKYPQLLFISDEVYEHIQFGEKHATILTSELLRERSFVIYSFGKTFHVTGWKIGYCVAPEYLTKELRSNFQFNVFCVNNTMQYAIERYMNSRNSWSDIPTFYEAKLRLFQHAMKPSKFKPLPCNGTYFCLYDFSEISQEPDTEFAKRITREFGVASIPVSVFYGLDSYREKTDNKVLRFCFAKRDETLLKAAELLCRI